MERVLLPNSAAVNFDLDTPTDYLILALSGEGGPRAGKRCVAAGWPDPRCGAARRTCSPGNCPRWP